LIFFETKLTVDLKERTKLHHCIIDILVLLVECCKNDDDDDGDELF